MNLNTLALTEHVRKSSDWICNYLNEIEQHSKKYRIKIIAGFEAKILADGSLDCPGQILKDYFIIASIHSKYDNVEWFRVLSRAVQNPDVDVIGHIGPEAYWSKLPSPAELAEIGTLVRDNNKIIELNVKYHRPPLNWLGIFKEQGVKFHLASDAHSLGEIGQFERISDLIALVENSTSPI
jgi:histidinol phosphatase-like PHP family hydrolase